MSSCHLNSAITMLDGPSRDALTEAIATLDAAEAQGSPGPVSEALAQVARCYRGVGLREVAQGYLQLALRWARPLGAVDTQVSLLCDMAELDLARATADEAAVACAAADSARDHCFEAATLARQTADPSWEVQVLLRVSDILDGLGDHGDAIALQCRALDLIAREHLHEPARLPVREVHTLM
jgi:hypothetical protein